MARQERDYSLLEGKVVTFIDRHGKEWKAVVTGCDKDIGITLQDSHDHVRYLMCLVGRCAPGNAWSDVSADTYETFFDMIIEQIDNGVVDCDPHHVFMRERCSQEEVGRSTAKSCSFNQ